MGATLRLSYVPQLKVYGGSPHVEKKLAELLSHRCCITFNSDDPACAPHNSAGILTLPSAPKPRLVIRPCTSVPTHGLCFYC